MKEKIDFVSLFQLDRRLKGDGDVALTGRGLCGAKRRPNCPPVELKMDLYGRFDAIVSARPSKTTEGEEVNAGRRGREDARLHVHPVAEVQPFYLEWNPTVFHREMMVSLYIKVYRGGLDVQKSDPLLHFCLKNILFM